MLAEICAVLSGYRLWIGSISGFAATSSASCCSAGIKVNSMPILSRTISLFRFSDQLPE
jgi:hypothetical protein